ncbi:26244_t:CDS:2, partial [Racocetra persica]
QSDSNIKKDLKYLKKILLLDDKWDAINDLVEILQPFTKATNYLGGTDINDNDDDDNFQDLFDDDTSDEEEENEQDYVKSTPAKKKTKSSILSSFKKHIPVTVEEISEYLKLEEIDIECDPFVW